MIKIVNKNTTPIIIGNPLSDESVKITPGASERLNAGDHLVIYQIDNKMPIAKYYNMRLDNIIYEFKASVIGGGHLTRFDKNGDEISSRKMNEILKEQETKVINKRQKDSDFLKELRAV